MFMITQVISEKDVYVSRKEISSSLSELMLKSGYNRDYL